MKTKWGTLVACVWTSCLLSTIVCRAEPEITKEIALKAVAQFRKEPLTPEGRNFVALVIKFAKDSPLVQVNIGQSSMAWLQEVSDSQYREPLLGAYVAGNAEAQLIKGTKQNEPDAGTMLVLDVYDRIKKSDDKFRSESLEKLAASGKFQNLRGGNSPKNAPSPTIAGDAQNLDTNLLFPENLGGLKRAQVHDLEKETPGAGTGATYRQDQTKADFYIYTNGQTSIPNGTASAVVQAEFEECKQSLARMQERGTYKSLEKVSEAEIKLGPAVRALIAQFSMTMKETEMQSYVLLTGYRNHFLKVRFSFPQSAAAAGEKLLQSFLSELTQLLVSGAASAQ